MRMTNGAAMTGKRVLGIAAASGAAVFVLASGGMASATPLPAHHSGQGGQGGLAPGTTPTPGPGVTGGQGGQAPTG